MLPPAPANLRKPLAGFGVDALQRGVEFGMRDRSIEAQPLGASASPAAGRLPLAAIVVVPLQMVVSAGTRRRFLGRRSRPPCQCKVRCCRIRSARSLVRREDCGDATEFVGLLEGPVGFGAKGRSNRRARSIAQL
jgi:hypothetical protein